MSLHFVVHFSAHKKREIQDSVTVDKLAVVFYSRSCLLYLGRIGARVKIMVLICGKRTNN